LGTVFGSCFSAHVQSHPPLSTAVTPNAVHTLLPLAVVALSPLDRLGGGWEQLGIETGARRCTGRRADRVQRVPHPFAPLAPLPQLAQLIAGGRRAAPPRTQRRTVLHDRPPFASRRPAPRAAQQWPGLARLATLFDTPKAPLAQGPALASAACGGPRGAPSFLGTTGAPVAPGAGRGPCGGVRPPRRGGGRGGAPCGPGKGTAAAPRRHRPGGAAQARGVRHRGGRPWRTTARSVHAVCHRPQTGGLAGGGGACSSTAERHRFDGRGATTASTPYGPAERAAATPAPANDASAQSSQAPSICPCAFVAPSRSPVLAGAAGHTPPVVTPPGPAGGARRHAVFPPAAPRPREPPTGVMPAWPGSIGQSAVARLPTVCAVVRHRSDPESKRTTSGAIAEGMPGALPRWVALGQRPTSRAGTGGVLAGRGHDKGQRQVVGLDAALRGGGAIVTGAAQELVSWKSRFGRGV
jgi:hypothetical protein